MDKSSTFETINVTKPTCERSRVRQTTVNFLKQFARAYTYDNRLKQGLGSFVAN